MVNRYGYTWQYLTSVEKADDEDGNPTSPTDTWADFECDVQTSSGRYVKNDNGDRVDVSFSIFTKIDTSLSIGGRVRDENQKEYVVLQIWTYGSLNHEIWV